MDTPAVTALQKLFKEHCKEEALNISALPVSGSSRNYYRIQGPIDTVIGAFNLDKRENRAFLYLSRHFREANLAVPQVFAADMDNNVYLQQDLGDTTLFSFLNEQRRADSFPENIKPLYRKAVRDLPLFQVIGHKGLDYSYCYPRAAFDKQSMLWDLNYFKYYFLKLANISFDEQSLEDDFQRFTDLLLSSPQQFFMYRDFQSRNIMVKGNSLYYIDYQGGRMGSPAYDMASLLFDAKANLPVDFRRELIDEYLSAAGSHYALESAVFNKTFYHYVYIRLMQAMGAYGFRGFYEKKEHFLQSIPYALKNLGWVLENHPLPGEFSALPEVLRALPGSSYLASLGKPALTVVIRSFSYKNGIPSDNSVHGGGFVFDCRALPNPGRFPEYQNVSGKDRAVIDFLDAEQEVADFLFNVYNIVDQSVKNYLQRQFERLTVNFGCTGGQHRSVYSAEHLKEHLEKKFKVNVIVEHREIQAP